MDLKLSPTDFVVGIHEKRFSVTTGRNILFPKMYQISFLTFGAPKSAFVSKFVCCCIICILIGALLATILSGVMSFISAVVMIQDGIATNQRVADEMGKNISNVAEQNGVTLPTNPPTQALTIPGIG